MPIADGYPLVFAKKVPTSGAAADVAVVHIPYTGSGYILRSVIQYNSKNGVTGATASNATTTVGVFTAAAGGGTALVADAAVAGLTGSTVVASRSIAAAGTGTLVTAPDLYVRVGTASGVANSVLDFAIEYSVLP